MSNPDWHNRKKYIRRLFLEQLGKSLTDPDNQRRSQQSGLRLKAKLALQSLGFQLKSEASINQVHMNDSNPQSCKTKKTILYVSITSWSQSSTRLQHMQTQRLQISFIQFYHCCLSIM
jgi:hypothetical protein